MPVSRRQQTEIIELKALSSFRTDSRLLIVEPPVNFYPEVSSIWIQTKRLLIIALLLVRVTPTSVEIRSGKISNRVAWFSRDCDHQNSQSARSKSSIAR